MMELHFTSTPRAFMVPLRGAAQGWWRKGWSGALLILKLQLNFASKSSRTEQYFKSLIISEEHTLDNNDFSSRALYTKPNYNRSSYFAHVSVLLRWKSENLNHDEVQTVQHMRWKKKIRIFLFSGLLGYSLRFAPFSIYLFYLSLLSRRNLKSVKACRSPAGQRARKGGKKRKERRMKDQDITNANMSAGWYYIVQINPEGNGQCMHTVGVIVIFSDNWW